jgi:hypothetical protein
MDAQSCGITLPEPISRTKRIRYAGLTPNHEAFIERCLSNPIARKVKIADLNDNLDIKRIAHDLTDKDVQRIRRYQRAVASLKCGSVDDF